MRYQILRWIIFRAASFLNTCLIKHSWTFLNINEHAREIWPARFKNNKWTFLNINELHEQRDELRAWHNRWETVTFASTPRSTCGGICLLHIVAVQAPCTAGSTLGSHDDMTFTEVLLWSLSALSSFFIINRLHSMPKWNPLTGTSTHIQWQISNLKGLKLWSGISIVMA